MKQYKTIDIARRIGIHVNTVRLYEKCVLIPKPERLPNGYRVFTDLHIEQFKLARAALREEVLQNGLRKQAVNIIKVSAAGNYEEAAALTRRYIQQVDQERKNAEEAIQITRKILAGLDGEEHTGIYFTRKEAADFLGVTIDTLRNWELNGLFTIKRRENGYRVYSEKDKVTPTSPILLLTVQVSIYAIYSLLSLILVYLVGSLFFGVRLPGSVGIFLASYFLVMLSTFSIGMMVGGVAPNMKVASIVASVLYFPMLIFSGATLPYEVMPTALQRIADILPLTQGIKLLKAASLGLPIEVAWLPLIVMVALIIICGGIAVKFFKWE